MFTGASGQCDPESDFKIISPHLIICAEVISGVMKKQDAVAFETPCTINTSSLSGQVFRKLGVG